MARAATCAAIGVAVAVVTTVLTGLSAAHDLPTTPKSPAQLLTAADKANPEWRKAAERVLPKAWVLGRLYRIDDSGDQAFFAAFPKGADTPWTPGNAFDYGQTVEVTLQRKDGQQKAVGARVYTRSTEDRDKSDGEQARLLSELYAAAQAEGASGVMVCRIRGWALSDSRAGTAVRKRPSDDAPIVGRLAPPYVSQSTDDSAFNGWRAEFDITGYKDGWFRIDKATPPGSLYDDEPPATHPKTYYGSGWVRVTEVTGAYSNTQMPVQRLHQYPNVDASSIEPGISASDDDGSLSIDGTLMRLHACSGDWALTTSRDGQRGWWRGVCSNQATNCS